MSVKTRVHPGEIRPPKEAHASLRAQESAGGRAPFTAKLARVSFQIVIGITVPALVAWTTISYAQTGDVAAPTTQLPEQQSAAREAAAPAADGLRDLDAVTFSCVRAGLNAAGREAAKAESQGAYQFSYFKIIKDSHHSFYEVHFKSNYPGEPDLKYCVAIYCQQGWHPKAAQTSVRRDNNAPPRAQKTAHGSHCGDEQMPVKRRAQ